MISFTGVFLSLSVHFSVGKFDSFDMKRGGFVNCAFSEKVSDCVSGRNCEPTLNCCSVWADAFK